MIDQPSLAAWQREPGTPLDLAVADLPMVGANEILIRNVAIAINPVDWLLQDNALFPWLDYPAVLGGDVAGEVVAIGSGVNRFKAGDRVLGQAVGVTTNQPAHGAFRSHTLVLANMAAPIPAGLAFTEAAVLPTGFGTAACGLFQKHQLALRYPARAPSKAGETVLVWGGSSSVGCNAIQLAVAAGYAVVTTASLRNEGMLLTLGVEQVFDHAAPDIVEQVVRVLAGKRLAGAFHATGSIDDCLTVVGQSDGRRFVACTLPPPEKRAMDVETAQIQGTSLKDDEVSRVLYGEFLPGALAGGKYRIAPRVRVVGHGLAALQAGLEAQKTGVSGEKIVIDLG